MYRTGWIIALFNILICEVCKGHRNIVASVNVLTLQSQKQVWYIYIHASKDEHCMYETNVRH